MVCTGDPTASQFSVFITRRFWESIEGFSFQMISLKLASFVFYLLELTMLGSTVASLILN